MRPVLMTAKDAVKCAVFARSNWWRVPVRAELPEVFFDQVAAEDLEGERIAVTGHRDGAVLDRAIEELLADVGVSAELVPNLPGPALHAAVAGNEVVALMAGPNALPSGVLARRLDPRRVLRFELLWRDEEPSSALAGFIGAATDSAERVPPTRALAAVA